MKSPNIFGGIMFIFLGAILLLNNFGLIGWDIWWTFFSFWPLFLIALGLRIMFRHNIFIQIVTALLILVVPLGYYLGYGSLRPFPGWNMPTGHYQNHTWSMEREANFKKAALKLEYGAGSLNMQASDKLLDLQAGTSAGRPEVKVNRSNDYAEISIKQDFKGFPLFMRPQQGGWNEEWNLGLSKNVVWDLELQTGATKGELNLQEINISRLDLDTGAGDVRLILGDVGTSGRIDVDSGAGNLTIVIPESVGVKAKIDTGLGQKNLPDRVWQQQGEIYISENYNSAATRFDLDIDHGAGNVNILTR